jgi:hypothetical protein
VRIASLGLLLCSLVTAAAQTNAPFDGRPWNISTGNLSVIYIQSCPMGAFPRTNFIEAPPAVDSLKKLKSEGLVGFEDYVGWGAVERSPDQWTWEEHDGMEKALHAAGLKYVVYDWVNFPPLWLRNQPADRTLMRCLEHNQETFYLSVFDPRTVKWYDHFYKNLHDHFGNRIDDVYACIMGPYGEGNYPQLEKSWVNMGHCHFGYWCGDEYAIRAFQAAMKKHYHRIASLNRAWAKSYKTFDDVQPPWELSDEKFVPKPEAFPTPQDKRRWLDFITWYHQALIDFSEQSLRTVLKYFPADKVRMKPGGSAGGVNPISWGTYCPGYAKMAGKYHVVLQPADCGGAVFADKWVGTAYQYYGVKEGTEPAGGLDSNAFVRRVFSDTSSGAAQFFTYEFEAHEGDMRKYVHLYTGKPGETEVAVYCPTTLYRLGADLGTTISAGSALRDICEFDVLDELLIGDGALKNSQYKALILFQGDIIDRPILDKIDKFQRHGGKVITIGKWDTQDVEGNPWKPSAPLIRLSPRGKGSPWPQEVAAQIAGLKGVDGKADGLWTCQRGKQTFIFNSTAKSVATTVAGQPIEIAPHAIWDSSAAGK